MATANLSKLNYVDIRTPRFCTQCGHSLPDGLCGCSRALVDSTCDTLPGLQGPATLDSLPSLPDNDPLDLHAQAAQIDTPFADGMRRLRISDAEGVLEAEVLLHEAVLARVPALSGDMGAAGEAIEVQLPRECPLASLNSILSRLYSSEDSWDVPSWSACGSGLAVAAGAMLLARHWCLDAVVSELMPVVQQRASDEESREWLRSLDGMCDLIPELNAKTGTEEASDSSSLSEMVLSVVTQVHGFREAQELLEEMLAKRRRSSWGKERSEDANMLIAVLRNVQALITLSSQVSVDEAHILDPGMIEQSHADQRNCNRIRIVRFPVSGFAWLWHLLEGYLSEDPSRGMDVLNAFEVLCWVECTCHHPTPDTALILDAASRKVLRRCFASFILQLSQQLASGHASLSTFLMAFALAAQRAAVPGPGPRDLWLGAVGPTTWYNALRMQPTSTADGRPGFLYVDDIDLLASVLELMCEEARMLVLDFFTDFRQWESVFSPRAVRCLSGEQQLSCVNASSIEWLSAGVCGSLRGSARQSARARLLPSIGQLDSLQLYFVAEGLSGQ